MGRVWIAEHLALETNVVVKFMANEISSTLDGAARFAREAAVAAAVKSPHVVQVFDHGVTADGDAYIVMELLEGRDLAAHLAAHGSMAAADVAGLVAQVAKALGKAHQVGIVHRDIKPDNIFLCEADGGELFVKLLDFGIAKREQRITDAATTTGAVIGTPYYMSPEQILGERDVDARTDVWSLGVVAYEALVGKRPFDGVTVGAITLAIHTKTPLITPHVEGLPPTVDDWFARACARDRSERFQTAREASLALLQAVGGQPSSVGLLRAPMPSVVADGSDAMLSSSASLEVARASEGRIATSLSSVSSASRAHTSRSALVIGGGVVGLLLFGGALLAVPPMLRSRATGNVASSADDAAVGSSAQPPPSSSNAPPDPSAVASPVAVAPSAAATAATAGGASVTRAAPPRSSTRPAARPAPAKPSRQGRTRDDDEIK